MNVPALEPSSAISMATECHNKRIEGHKEPVPGYSTTYDGIIDAIHFCATVSNWLLLSICIYLMMHRTDVISIF
jgi:hypothetical protein